MENLTLALVSILLTIISVRLILLELQVKKLRRLNKRIYKDANQMMSRFMDDLQRPLTGLLGIRSMYASDKELNSKLSDYTDIVEHCTHQSKFEINKAQLFFELCSEQYEPQIESAPLKQIFEDANKVVSHSMPCPHVSYSAESMNDDIILENIDRRLYKAFFYTNLKQMAELAPDSIDCSIEVLNSGQIQIEFNGRNLKAHNANMTLGSLFEIDDELLFANNTEMSMDEKLAISLQTTLNIVRQEYSYLDGVRNQRLCLILPASVSLQAITESSAKDNISESKRQAA